MNSKGFQLSINMLVVIILGIAMLGIGTSLFYNAYDKTVELKENVNSQTQARLNSLLDDGSIVVIPQKNFDANRGDLVEFSMGVTNIHPESKDFLVYVTYGGSSAYPNSLQDPFNPFDLSAGNSFDYSCANDGDVPEICGDSWVFMLPDSKKFTLKANTRKFMPIGIKIPKSKLVVSGQYVFNVDICLANKFGKCDITSTPDGSFITDESRYDSRHKIMIKV